MRMLWSVAVSRSSPAAADTMAPSPHGELEVQVEIRRDEAAGVDGPREGGGEVTSFPFQDLHLLMVQRVFESAAHVDVVPAHRNGLQLMPGSGHQEVLEASDDGRFRPPVRVGEVEPGGEVDAGQVLKNLEREFTHRLTRLQDEALVRVGPLVVRGEGCSPDLAGKTSRLTPPSRKETRSKNLVESFFKVILHPEVNSP